MNTGKIFENDFRNSKPDGVWLYRLKDGSSAWAKSEDTRFQSHNISDYLMYKSGSLLILELKSVKASSIPFSDIRYSNLCEMVEASRIQGITALVIINFRREKQQSPETYAVPAELVKDYMDNADRKSIPLSWAKDNGIMLPAEKKRTRYRYDLNALLQ